MKRIILYIVIIGLSFAAPLERADVARLEPVEAVAINKTGEWVTLITDTGNFGVGMTAAEALVDLKQNTPAVIYLDTAKYLLVNESAVDEVDKLRSDLKGSVYLCKWNGEGELKDAVKYLTIHGDLPELCEWEKGVEIPVYICKK